MSLYGLLVGLWPLPLVALNRAVPLTGRRPNSNSPATAPRAAARSDFYVASGAH